MSEDSAKTRGTRTGCRSRSPRPLTTCIKCREIKKKLSLPCTKGDKQPLPGLSSTLLGKGGGGGDRGPSSGSVRCIQAQYRARDIGVDTYNWV